MLIEAAMYEEAAAARSLLQLASSGYQIFIACLILHPNKNAEVEKKEMQIGINIQGHSVRTFSVRGL